MDSSLGRLGLPLLHEEEAEQRDDGEGGEAGGGDVEGHVAARDCLDDEEVRCLGSVGGLPVADLVAGGVEGVNPNEVGGLRHVLLHQVGVGVVGGGAAVGLLHDQVLAGLVLL